MIEDINNFIYQDNSNLHYKDIIDNLFTLRDISIIKKNINYGQYYNYFYNHNFLIKDNISLLEYKIKNILLKKIDDKEINHINRFLHLNSIFELLNELNSKYNILNKKNYTLLLCFDIYFNIILANKELYEHWFKEILAINKYNNYSSDKNYLQGFYIILNIFKYTDRCNSKLIILKKKYVQYIKYYLDINIKSLEEKIDIINNNNILNKKILIGDSDNNILKILTNKILNELVVYLIPDFSEYLNMCLIENKFLNIDIIEFFKIIYDENIYAYIYTVNNYLKLFIKARLSNIDKDDNFECFLKIDKILPLIPLILHTTNKYIDIDYLYEFFEINKNLINILLVALHLKIINFDCVISIKNLIDLILIYNNNDFIIEEYNKWLYIRIKEYIKKNILFNSINYEFIILNNFRSNSSSFKILDNLYKNKKFNDNTMINYLVLENNNIIDNNITKISLNLINENNLPNVIKNYIRDGYEYVKSYSKKYHLYSLDLSSSIIEFKLKNCNIIGSVFDYILLYQIYTNKNISINKLEKIIFKNDNNKFIIDERLNVFESNGIINKESNIVINDNFNQTNIDLLDNTQKLKEMVKVNKCNQSNNNLDIIYLKIIYLSKMFKQNSTSGIKKTEIVNMYNKFINENYAELNIFIDDDIDNYLDELEKRCIIDKVVDDNEISYFYII